MKIMDIHLRSQIKLKILLQFKYLIIILSFILSISIVINLNKKENTCEMKAGFLSYYKYLIFVRENGKQKKN